MMAKRKEIIATDEPAKVRGTRYRFTGGRIAVAHPAIGTVTKDHIEGPNAEVFIKAFKVHDGKTNGEWLAKNIETLN